jgi:hypothetical protein
VTAYGFVETQDNHHHLIWTHCPLGHTDCSYIVVATIGGGNKAVSTKSGQVLGKQLTPGTSQAKVHRELDLKTYLIVEKKVFFKIMIWLKIADANY